MNATRRCGRLLATLFLVSLPVLGFAHPARADIVYYWNLLGPSPYIAGGDFRVTTDPATSTSIPFSDVIQWNATISVEIGFKDSQPIYQTVDFPLASLLAWTPPFNPPISPPDGAPAGSPGEGGSLLLATNSEGDILTLDFAHPTPTYPQLFMAVSGPDIPKQFGVNAFVWPIGWSQLSVPAGDPTPPAPTPEPSTIAIAGLGALCFAAYGWARKHRAKRQAS